MKKEKEEKMTFEQAMADLEAIVAELERGELSLEKSVERFKHGMEISNYCSNMLDEAEKSITILLKDQNGGTTEAPFEL